MKRVQAIAPYIHPGFLNFKMAPYEAWQQIGGSIAKDHYPWRMFHGLAYRWEFPTLWKNKTEARLRFVEPVSISFDTFPDYARYEIIPFVWDCWPCHFEKMCRWLTKHDVQTAIFTSSQTAERIKKRFPSINVMFCPEGIDIQKYGMGKLLKYRCVDAYEIGGIDRSWFKRRYPSQYAVLFNKAKDWPISDHWNYSNLLQNSKISIIFPKSDCVPEIAEGLETLTQRYWECMLSRMVMVGHAPKELVDLIGYNPVIELNRENAVEHISQILSNIDDEKYQKFVNKNRQVALEMGPWSIRMRQVVDWLKQMGYEV